MVAERVSRCKMRQCAALMPYNVVWHGKLAFHDVPSGDQLAFDLNEPSNPVVYLSHDDGEGHGYRLGNDFIDFVERWSMVGCTGPEDW